MLRDKWVFKRTARYLANMCRNRIEELGDVGEDSVESHKDGELVFHRDLIPLYRKWLDALLSEPPARVFLLDVDDCEFFFGDIGPCAINGGKE